MGRPHKQGLKFLLGFAISTPSPYSTMNYYPISTFKHPSHTDALKPEIIIFKYG
jgi:hypothetical protein